MEARSNAATAPRKTATAVQAAGITPPFAKPLSGPELMDASTYAELCSRLAAREEDRPEPQPQPPRRRAAPPRVASERVFDLAELGARVLSAPAQAARAPARRAPHATTSPAAAASLEAEIDRSSSSEAVAHLAVRLAHRYAKASALLLVHRGIVQGLCADGIPVRLDAILFPSDAESLFGEVAASGQAFRGAPRAGGLDTRILRALGRESVCEIAILPIRLGGRVVNLLYADNGPEALGDTCAAALSSVCTRVAAAYERLIRVRKHGSKI